MMIVIFKPYWFIMLFLNLLLQAENMAAQHCAFSTSAVACVDCQRFCFPNMCNIAEQRRNCRRTCQTCHLESEVCLSLNCTHRCIAANASIPTTRCACLSGYELDEDGRTCNDIDECARNSSICNNLGDDAVCVNLEGSFTCTSCENETTSNRSQYYQRDECCTIDTNSQCGKSNAFGGRRLASPIGAPLQRWPWMASIRSDRNCGGTLILRNYVITEALCLFDDSSGFPFAGTDLTIILGAVDINDETNTRGQVYSAYEIIIHPKFDSNSIVYNIALIRLNESARINSFVSTLCLPNEEVISVGDICYGTGFGSNGTLRQFDIPIRLISRCQEFLDNTNSSLSSLPPNLHICAGFSDGDKEPCAGDGGGPLACQRRNSCDWYLAGIFSFGFRECGISGPPGSYPHFTNVVHFESWIASTIIGKQIEPTLQRNETGLWSAWGPWESCTRSCNGGEGLRTRICINELLSGQQNCTGDSVQIGRCNTQLCPFWGRFSSWTLCPVTCGIAIKSRTRSCSNGKACDKGCTGTMFITALCSTQLCSSSGSTVPITNAATVISTSSIERSSSNSIPVDVTVVISVLGSVLLLCLSAIFVFVKRKKKIRAMARARIRFNEPSNRNDEDDSEAIYETVGPLVPVRPPDLILKIFSDYEMPNDIGNKDHAVMTEEDGYLKPMVNEIPLLLEEEGYSKLSKIQNLELEENSGSGTTTPIENNDDSAFFDKNDYVVLTHDEETKFKKNPNTSFTLAP